MFRKDDGLANIYDGSNETSFKTSGNDEGAYPPYPWIQIQLKRRYLITKVAILSGEEQLMNLQVRVGTSQTSLSWVEVDCGLEKGIKGKFIT